MPASPATGTAVTCSVLALLALGPPAAPAQRAAAEPAAAPARHTPGDVAFVQGMIHHHAQALVMTALVPARAGDRALDLLAERITISQRDEIRLMQRWLARHDAEVPHPPVTLEATREHAHHGTMMPGMLTPEQLDRLAAAQGAVFDRLFLEFMIAHHEGALVMVRDLFATPGAGQDSWIFQFAADVDADQRAEIRRMRSLLENMQP